MQPPPPVTRALLIAVFVMLLLQLIPGLPIGYWFPLEPLQSGIFWPWQVVTYAFMHRQLGDAFFNMLAFWMFGAELELLWGARRYIQYLLASVLAAAAIYLLVSLVIPGGALIGAAGAVFGLLLAFGLLFPRRPILFFMVFPTDMRTAVILFGVIEIVFTVLQYGATAATNLAHLGGMLGGYLMILWWRRRPPSRARRR